MAAPNDDEKSQLQANQQSLERRSYFVKRLMLLKKSDEYKIMVEKGFALLDNELLALIYYCDDESACFSMKQYHRTLEMECKWGNLYYHLTNAVDKLHQCFHLKNDEREEFKRLFHGSRCDKLDIYSQHQLFLKTITSFSYDFGIAKSFAQARSLGETLKADGMILVLDGPEH
eukprot:523672_1